MKGDTKIIVQPKLTFILTPHKVIITTSRQAFYLSPRDHHVARRVIRIRRMIEDNEVKDLNDLALCCEPGIAWVATNKLYELDKIHQFDTV